MSSIRTLLVPIDFTDVSEHALDVAIDLAKQVGAAIVVMHAYEIPVYGLNESAFIPSGDVAMRIGEAARMGLERVVAKRSGCGIALKPDLRMGPVAEEVTKAAEAAQADMIVVGTHGRRGLSRALLGSIAENVIRTSTRPVLAVHAPNAA